MRVIGGRLKGRRLSGPAGAGSTAVRPTSDRAREAIFQIIGPKVTGAGILDLFAGTGAMGIEAASRGASRVVSVDNSRAMLNVARQNILACDADASVIRAQHGKGMAVKTQWCEHLLIQADLSRSLATLCLPGSAGLFDIIFCDPPYGWQHLNTLVKESAALLVPGGLMVVETWTKEYLDERYLTLSLTDIRRYGAACFWLYTKWS